MKLIVLALALLAPLAQAKNGFYPTNFNPAAREFKKFDAAGGKLVYYGGPVISHAKVYVVFWGPNVVADVKSGIAGFYNAAANSTYMDWLDEYATYGKALDGRDGTKQHIGRGKYVGMATITPSHTAMKIDDVDIQAEMQAQIDAGKLPKPDDDTLFMIYFPPGITITAAGAASCSEFCAYHGFKGEPERDHFFYGVMPDLGGMCSFGCGFSSHFDSVTSISSHEMIEAITDPFPTPGSNPAYPQAWNDVQGSEIADICAGTDNVLSVASSQKTFKVQSEWDNTAGSCTAKSWSAP